MSTRPQLVHRRPRALPCDRPGWLLVLVNQRHGRIFENAPEGILEWPEITPRADTWHAERNLSAHGGPRAGTAVGDRLVDAGSHLDHHRDERRRRHVRQIAAVVAGYLRARPDAGVVIDGPVEERSLLRNELPPSVSGRVAAELAIPVDDPASSIAHEFESFLATLDGSGARE